jgi:hypothetical protein
MTKFLEIAASPVSLDAKLKALAISLDKTLPDLYNKVVIVEKQQGPKGDKGDTGLQGPKGEQGDKGFQGNDGQDGRNGENGKDGEDGKDGVSVVDVYISADNSLVCVLSDGREVDAGPFLTSPVIQEQTIYNRFGGDSTPFVAGTFDYGLIINSADILQDYGTL